MSEPSAEKSGLTHEEIRLLLKPLIDIDTCDRTSLSALLKKREQVLSKMRETDRPLLIDIFSKGGGYETLLVCDARLYLQLEIQRRLFLSPGVKGKTIDEIVQVGKVIPPSEFLKLAELEEEANALKSEIKVAQWRIEQTQTKLRDVENQIEGFHASGTL